MKRLVKWSLILGGIFCLAGVGTITAGAMMGGVWGIQDLGRLEKSWHVELGKNRMLSDGNTPESDKGDPAEETYSGIRSLELKMGKGEVELRNSLDPSQTELVVEHVEKEEGSRRSYQIWQEGDTLKIDSGSGWEKGDQEENMEPLILYIPDGLQFQELEVDLGAGSFYAETLRAQEAEFKVRVGEIQIADGELGSLDVECQAGQVFCCAPVSGNADVECEAGSVTLTMAGTQSQYNYKLDCRMGRIFLNGEQPMEYTTLKKEQKIDNQAKAKVELECATGEITVEYEQGENV